MTRLHLVSPEYPPVIGGIASWAYAVARACRDAGIETVVHAPGRTEGATRIWGRSWARWGPVWSALHLRPRLRSGDAVLAATWPLAAHLLGVAPLAVAYHGSDLTRPPLVAGRDNVVQGAVNLPVSDDLGGLLGAAYWVLPFPIAPMALASGGDALLVVARLTPLKGVDRALRLGHRLGRRVIVVGDGPERRRLEALAMELGTNAQFLGATRAIPWSEAWALALLSRPDADGSGQEGLGLVMLEAAARGIPTIGSRCGGIPEAASVVLDDPESDEIPPLPGSEAVQAALAAKHGPDRCVAALRSALGWR